MSDAPSPDGQAKKKSPLVLIIVAASVLIGGGAAAFVFMGGGGGGAAPAPAAGGHGEGGAEGHDGEAAAKAAKAGAPIAEFPPLVVNLNEPEGTRYLKAAIAVQLSDAHLASEVERLRPVITDAFVRELSELNVRQTMGSKAKVAVKRRLLKRFNEAVGAEAAVDVLLTEFVVQ